MVKVLVADDHKVIRQALCELLRKRNNFELVAEASDGEELLRLLKAHPFDVVVMDVAMPRLGGVGALEVMEREKIEVPVLVLSADDGPKNVRSVIKAGAKGFMPKNSGIEELVFAIESILQGRTYLSPSITEHLVAKDGEDVLNGSSLSVLTKRELEILKHLAEGKPNRVIGKMLHISKRTVDTHRSNILKKLSLQTNAELVKLAISEGIISV
jgi:DNA-binding NarL/FixJ family response regulator